MVVSLGVSTAPAIAARLAGAGRDLATPVLVVESASLPHERRVLTTLGGLVQAIGGWDGPALLIIGEAAALADVGNPAAPSIVTTILGRRA